MSELTVITTEELGSPVGSLEVKGRWRLPARLNGVAQLERPWHPEGGLALPLGAIAVDPDRIFYWEGRQGGREPCKPKRVSYLLGLLALPVAIEGDPSDEELVTMLTKPESAWQPGYTESRVALAGLVRRYIAQDAKATAHYGVLATAEYSRRYKPPSDPQDLETLLEELRNRLPDVQT